MKKIVIAFLVLMALFASSCSGVLSSETYRKQLMSDYSVNATVIENGSEYTVRMIHSSDGKFDIVFAQPSALWGMGYSFDGEDSYLIYNDMTISLSESVMSENMGAGVYRWRELMSSEGTFAARYTDYDGIKCVALEDEDRTIYFDKSDKSLVALKSENTEIRFKDFESESTNDELQTESMGGN